MGGNLVPANPYGTPVLNGPVPEFPDNYIDLSFDYVYDVAMLASAVLRDQSVPIHTDSDFVLRAIILSQATGAFSIRFNDSQGYYLSAGFMMSANFLSGTVPYPYPIFPELLFPAGSRIGIEINELTAAPNTVQLVFRGAKRYRLPAVRR
jgi:hypothetical protein